MRNNRTSVTAISLTALLGLAFSTGCRHDRDTVSTRAQDFTPPGAISPVETVAEAQAIKGAAADAMLYDRHFDGVLLNSLGRRKLDLMMRGTSINKPLTVYLDMPKDTATTRQTAVAEYIKDAGVQDSAVQIVIGPNPNVTTPTAYNLSEIYKEDGNVYTGAAADATAAGPAAPAGGSTSGK